MIKRLLIGNYVNKYKKEIDIFFSVYRNNVLEKFYSTSFNKINQDIFDMNIQEKIENNNKIIFIIDNILKSYIEKKININDHVLNKDDFKFLYSDALVRLTNLAWFVFCLIKRISYTYNDEELVIIIPRYKKKFFDKPKYSNDLASLISNPDFIDYIVSKCFCEVAPSNWKIVYKENLIQKIKLKKSNHTNLLLRFILGLGRCSHEEFNYFSSLLMGVCFSFKKVKNNIKFSELKRDNFSFDQHNEIPSEFIDFFLNILDEALPSYFYNDFYRDFYLISKLPLFKRGYSRLINTYSNSDRFNLFNLIASKKGENILLFQHGLSYGMRLIMPTASVREFSIGGYISWGWDNHGVYVKSFFKMPSPKLSEFSKFRTSAKVEKHIMFVGTKMDINDLTFNAKPILLNYLKYRKDKLCFLDFLNRDVLQNLLYRGGAENYQNDLSDSTFLKNKYKELKLCKSNFRDNLANCSLAVIDHPTTAFAESISANIPTIGFWDPNLWHFTVEADNSLMILKEMGILFDDPISAAKKLNQIYPNYEEWWSSAELQYKRREWCSKYTLINKNWFRKWLSIF